AALLAGHVRRALLADAHEIHFLPAAEEIHVYHRIGGALVYAGSGPASLTYLLLARLEALGGPAYDGELTHARGRAVCPLGDHDALLDVSLLRVESGLAIVLAVRSAGGAAPRPEGRGACPLGPGGGRGGGGPGVRARGAGAAGGVGAGVGPLALGLPPPAALDARRRARGRPPQRGVRAPDRHAAPLPDAPVARPRARPLHVARDR